MFTGLRVVALALEEAVGALLALLLPRVALLRGAAGAGAILLLAAAASSLLLSCVHLPLRTSTWKRINSETWTKYPNMMRLHDL